MTEMGVVLKTTTRFFNAQRKEKIEMLARTDSYIGEAYETLQALSADERKRMEYEARMKTIRDYESNRIGAERRGEARGIEIGREQGIKIGEENALNALSVLIKDLRTSGREEDIDRVLVDAAYRDKMLAELRKDEKIN